MRKKVRGILLVVFILIFCTGCGKNKELEAHYDKGNEYLENGQFEEALVEFEQAYSESTKDDDLENNKKVYRCEGITYYKMGEYEKAVKMFQYALDIPLLTDINLDILKYKILAEEAMGDYASAVTDFDAAIAIELGDFELYFGKFFAQKELGDERGALATLEQALTIGGEGDEYKFNLAKIYYYMEQYEVAISGFKELRDELPQVEYFLGDCYYKKREYKRAIESFERALEQENEQDKGLIYNQIGNCYMAEGKYEKALEYFKLGQKVEDTIWKKPLLYNQIVALEKLQKLDKALEMCNKYLELYPNDERVEKEKAFLETRVN